MKVSIQLLGNLFVKMMTFERAGEIHEGHAHTYDHTTLLASGQLAVESNGKRSEWDAPFLISVPKNVSHTLIALAEGTVVCCLHALHAKDNPGDIVDPESVPAGTPPWADIFVPMLAAEARQFVEKEG